MRRFAAALLTIPLLVAGTVPAHASDLGSAKPTPVKPEGHTFHPHKTRWQTATPIKHGRYLRITWWSGVAPCTVVDHIKVRESRKTVTVTLYEGARSGSRGVMCVAIAVKKVATIKLPHPLGHRKIVDGARN
ncbi:hypothetical protein J5X84_06770 [Streptosporangiaceae bacterium NEAU-GS5]|nr:hypothetical protein [Streptosporangiaceae bacterium NEAU-GS5]